MNPIQLPIPLRRLIQRQKRPRPQSQPPPRRRVNRMPPRIPRHQPIERIIPSVQKQTHQRLGITRSPLRARPLRQLQIHQRIEHRHPAHSRTAALPQKSTPSDSSHCGNLACLAKKHQPQRTAPPCEALLPSTQSPPDRDARSPAPSCLSSIPGLVSDLASALRAPTPMLNLASHPASLDSAAPPPPHAPSFDCYCHSSPPQPQSSAASSPPL